MKSNLQQLTLLWENVLGGIAGALISVPIILSCGVVSYQSIGPTFVTAGISAAFVAACVATVISGFFGGSPLHISSPKTTHAAILSGLIATIATHHSFTSFYGVNAPAALMTICFLTLLVSGITQVLLGASRMGVLVKFIPYPVLAGFINGFALQIILTQIPNLLGFDHPIKLLELLSGTLPINGWSLGFALFSGGMVLLAGKVSKLIPAAIIGLFSGTLVHILAGNYVSADFGPVIGVLPSGIPFDLHINDMLQFVSTSVFSRHAFSILATGVTLAFVSSIQSLLSISVSDRLFGTRHNSNRELLVQGVSNVLSAIFGGAPSGGSPNVTQIVFASGGRTGVANLACAATLLGLSFGLTQFIALIPLSVIAGVVVVTTLGSMDKWTQQLLVKIGSSAHPTSRGELAMNLAIVILVTVLVVLAGALAALGAGMAIAFMAFLYRTNTHVVHRVLYANQINSRTERPFTALDALAQQGRRIVIIELEGPLFFGSAETVIRSVERELSTACCIILDLKRVSHLDSSGVMMLKRLDDTLSQSKKHLLLSYLPADGNRRKFINSIGFTKPEKEKRIYENTDAALAWAEDELLRELDCLHDITDEFPLEIFEICRNLSDDEFCLLKTQLICQHRTAGEIIFYQGDKTRSLFFLVQGRVSVQLKAHGQTLRMNSYLSGVVFGEMALLSEEPRAATVVTDTAVILFELTKEAFEYINYTHPILGAKLVRNIAVELSCRVRQLTHIVCELEA